MEERPTLATPAESPESPAPTPTEGEPTYVEGEWSGLPHYLCLACGHQTWDLEATAAHQTLMHAGVMRAFTLTRPADAAGAVGTAGAPEESAADQAGEEAPAEEPPPAAAGA